mgnify:CR=1 FL=1
MEVLYRYIGEGAYVVDLPARDILASETKYHEGCEANSKTTLPCYVKVEAKAAKAHKTKEVKESVNDSSDPLTSQA